MDERRDVPGPTVALPETTHLWPSVVIRRLIRDSGTGAKGLGKVYRDTKFVKAIVNIAVAI